MNCSDKRIHEFKRWLSSRVCSAHHAVIDDGLQRSSWVVTIWGGVQGEFRQAHWQHAARLLGHRERLGLKGRLCRRFDAVKLSLQLKKSRLSVTTADHLFVNISFHGPQAGRVCVCVCVCVLTFLFSRKWKCCWVRGLPQFRKSITWEYFCVFAHLETQIQTWSINNR